jgi:hypothetical protein
MRRVIYAISSAAIISMAACATSNAAPIAPIPTAAVANAGNLIQVGYYYHGRYYPYHRHYYHRDYYARLGSLNGSRSPMTYTEYWKCDACAGCCKRPCFAWTCF